MRNKQKAEDGQIVTEERRQEETEAGENKNIASNVEIKNQRDKHKISFMQKY